MMFGITRCRWMISVRFYIRRNMALIHFPSRSLYQSWTDGVRFLPTFFRIIPHKINIPTDHQMITHPIFRSIIRVKWDLYARRYFIRQLLFSFLPVLLFTLSVNLDSGSKTQTTKDLQYGVGTAAFAFIFVGLYDVLHDYREVYQKTNFLPRHLRNLEHLSVWRTLDDRMEYLWKLIRRDVDEDFIRIVFGVCVILAFAMSTADRVGQGVDMSKFPRIQAVGLVFGWLRILYYARGIKSVGPLVLALSEIIAKGFMHWIVIYAAIVVGFSTAFYALMKNMDYAAMGLTTIPYDWNYYGGSVLWTVRFLFGMLDFDNLRSVAGDFGVAIFVLHQFVVIIVLLNVLIALLVGVFESVSEQYESQWLLQMARTVINQTSTVT
ncbi:hypothetical protein BCR33DRAFT_155638 [Rhizoclosmatium globosum]|uniref:Ion transport domain-containing protein n=1 Tax=Rhizoclosmatium globosum TaxID=329046 RepID=A0A1Y2CFV2_9FUNG|nr:hypothetical protein BCR33DRAFT_155638 [Rhizoclosmatium globosum]|eukprot:ORY45930.1 hypothetical protein BCR33DRAFT_155638 [Rhizoclosmatium globosum]